MIRLSVLYARSIQMSPAASRTSAPALDTHVVRDICIESEGATFDHDYYRDAHVPLAVATWKPASAEIDEGLDGPYVAAVHLTFASQEAMAEAMASEGTAAIQADVANYTSITPVLQVSRIVS